MLNTFHKLKYMQYKPLCTGTYIKTKIEEGKHEALPKPLS